VSRGAAARSSAFVVATAIAAACSGSLHLPAPSTTTTTTEPRSTTTSTAPDTSSTLTTVTRPATTTTTAPLDIPPNARAIVIATRDDVVAVIGNAAWDDALPVPQAGLARATWQRDDDHGGTLTLMMPVSATDTAGFFRFQLSQRGFKFTEEDAGGVVSVRLGDQATIVVQPGGVAACTVVITVKL